MTKQARVTKAQGRRVGAKRRTAKKAAKGLTLEQALEQALRQSAGLVGALVLPGAQPEPSPATLRNRFLDHCAIQLFAAGQHAAVECYPDALSLWQARREFLEQLAVVPASQPPSPMPPAVEPPPDGQPTPTPDVASAANGI